MHERAVGSVAERSLSRRLRAGDGTALSELYDEHSGFVYGLALRVIGDKQAAEDVTQEVFVSVWQQPDRFGPDRGSMRAFLGTLAHRRAVDLIRREEARRRRETRTSAESASSVSSGCQRTSRVSPAIQRSPACGAMTRTA